MPSAAIPHSPSARLAEEREPADTSVAASRPRGGSAAIVSTVPLLLAVAVHTAKVHGSTADCVGVLWRPGGAGTAPGAAEWVQTLGARLRAAGVHEIPLRLLWAMGALAYQLLHGFSTTALSGRWHQAQPERLRSWIIRLTAKLPRHALKTYVQRQRSEPLRAEFPHALRSIANPRALSPGA